jgi:DNA-directed RNA polymerase subunit RPC12/RpoP
MVRGPVFISAPPFNDPVNPFLWCTMSSESLNCNECGALIPVPSVARYATCNRCGAHLVVKRTDVAAYTELAGGVPGASESPASPNPALRELTNRLDSLEYRNALAQIDHEWEMERERYMTSPAYGRSHAPSMVQAVFIGMFSIGLGLYLIYLAFDRPGGVRSSGSFSLLVGLIFFVAGLGTSIHRFIKARKYQAAFAEYQRRRAALRDRLGE